MRLLESSVKSVSGKNLQKLHQYLASDDTIPSTDFVGMMSQIGEESTIDLLVKRLNNSKHDKLTAALYAAICCLGLRFDAELTTDAGCRQWCEKHKEDFRFRRCEPATE